MTVDQLQALNAGLQCAGLQIGQVLCVSSSKKRSVAEKRDAALPGLFWRREGEAIGGRGAGERGRGGRRWDNRGQVRRRVERLG